jgi:hypothetical protein
MEKQFSSQIWASVKVTLSAHRTITDTAAPITVAQCHGKQEPIFVDHKVFANPSAYVKYSVEFAFAANAT